MQKTTVVRTFLLLLFLAALGCSTQSVEDSSPGSQGGSPADDFSDFDSSTKAGASSGGDEFADFGSAGAEAAPADGENAIEKEMQQADGGKATQDEFAQFQDPPAAAEVAPSAPVPPAVDPGPEALPTMAVETAPPTEEPAPPAEPVMDTAVKMATIKALNFKANDNGGTVVIEADAPIEFQTRSNKEKNQFVIEVPNSKLAKKLKRPLNTRDFAGIIGGIDAYQGSDGTTSNIVVQLRNGDQEPTVQAEGNSLLVITAPPAPMALTENKLQEPVEPDQSKLMTSESLEDFIANNQTFYGKPISIETDDADVRDVMKLISDEANVNLILNEDVKGKITVKLKNVPWDHALVLIMKSKKLGYVRKGNVIRISSLADIRNEEKEAVEVSQLRKLNEVPKVKTLQVNYAKVEDLATQTKGLLSKAGTVVADPRTSSLIITDIQENIDRVAKVIASLDVPPQQVLIEGKVVEATENLEENFGINWSAPGDQFQPGKARSSRGDIIGNAGFNVTPGGVGSSTFRFDLSMGTFDILGNLTASLGLFESEGKAKILSSPRIVTMHNEKASIEQTLEVPVRSSSVSGGVVTDSIQFKEVKLLLEVTPQVTNDGAVMMNLKIQREFLGDVADAKSGARSANRRLAQTRVLVKNAQTAVIGGIYQNDTQTGETRVPGISKLPIIGWLFKGSTSTDQKNELLIFLTPRILGNLDNQVIPSQNNNQAPVVEELKF